MKWNVQPFFCFFRSVGFDLWSFELYRSAFLLPLFFWSLRLSSDNDRHSSSNRNMMSTVCLSLVAAGGRLCKEERESFFSGRSAKRSKGNSVRREIRADAGNHLGNPGNPCHSKLLLNLDAQGIKVNPGLLSYLLKIINYSRWKKLRASWRYLQNHENLALKTMKFYHELERNLFLRRHKKGMTYTRRLTTGSQNIVYIKNVHACTVQCVHNVYL